MFNFKRKRDKGYVLAFVAILLIPLLAFTSFSVDLGSWYSRASSMQQAADAAALAGASFLPNREKAKQEARLVAQANGFAEDGSNGVKIDFPSDINDPEAGRKFTVLITLSGSGVPSYFSGVLGQNNTSIIRSSTAEYVPSPKMGSPRNYIGTGNCPLGGWNNANGPFGLENGSPDSCVSSNDVDYPSLREGWVLVEGPQCGPIGEAGTRYSSPVLGSASGNGIRPVQPTQTQLQQGFYMPTPEERALRNRCVPGEMTARDGYTREESTKVVPLNPEYRHNGTTFGITVPAGQSVVVQGFNVGAGIFDVAQNKCRASDPRAGYSEDFDDPRFTNTTYRFLDNGSFDPNASPSPPYVPSFNAPTGEYITVAEKPCSLRMNGSLVGGSKSQWNGWYTISPALTAPADKEKTYWLNVKLGESVLQSNGAPRSDLPAFMTEGNTGSASASGYINYYSLRVKPTASPFVPCTSDPQDPVINFPGTLPASSCPSIYAIEYLQADFRMSSSDSEILDRDFYLSEFDENQVGNTASVEINDTDFRTLWLAIMSPNPASRASDRSNLNDPGAFDPAHPYETFTPQILCMDGQALPRGSLSCPRPSYSNYPNAPYRLQSSPSETPPGVLATDAAQNKPAGTYFSGNTVECSGLSQRVSYNMCPGTRFFLFRGPTPYSGANPYFGSGNNTAGAPTGVWYNTQNNQIGFNAPLDGSNVSPLGVEGMFFSGTTARKILNEQRTFPDGLSSRTLRMNFPIRPLSETQAGVQDGVDNGFWWKIRFRNPGSGGQNNDDRMTWRIITTGDPVRLIPSNF